MKWSWQDILKILMGGGGVAAIIALFRFRKKDKADVRKIESETEVDIATVNAKKIDDEIKISKAALDWTIQLAAQLEKANQLNEKRQLENERLHIVIDTMKKDFAATVKQMQEDFDARIEELEEALEESQKTLVAECNKYQEEITKLRAQINGANK